MMLSLILIVCIVKNVASYNLADFYNLPKIHKMESYANCVSENNLFCELEFEVKSANNESKSWKIIQNCDAEKSFYDRKILYRAMCLPKLYKDEEIKLKEIGLARMKNELQSYDLDADLIHFYCKLNFTNSLKDYIKVCVLCLYFCWIIIATLIDYFTKTSPYFSVIYTYKKLMKNTKNPHYNRLKFMQGVRLYCVLFVVVGHSILAHVTMYTENPEFFEELYSYKIMVLLSYFLSVVVTNLFILSGWLSVLEIDKMSNNFSKFTMQDIFLLFVHRLLRYAPILVFNYCLGSSVFLSNDMPCTKLMDRFLINCKIGWLYILVQNWFYSSDCCNSHFWFISVDIQVFIILLAVFYITIKYKLPLIRCLLMLCLFFTLIQIIIIYYNNMNAVFTMTARNALPLSRKSLEGNLNYMFTIPNVPSYLIGSIFGILYLRNLNNRIFENKLMKIIWILTATGLIVSALSLIDTPKSRLTKSIFGGSLKPIYATGVAVFLFGLAQNASDKLRKMFEIRLIEILGKCTLSIYLNHIPVSFARISETYVETKIVSQELIFAIIGDLFKSIMLGFVLHLTIEQPFAILTRRDKEGKKIDNKVK